MFGCFLSAVFSFQIAPQTFDIWVKDTVILMGCKLSQWWQPSSLDSMISTDVLLQLPAWSSFPDIRFIIDSTLHRRHRPTQLQGLQSETTNTCRKT